MEQKTKRKSKINYYLDIAMEVASRSTCIRRKYGAVAVKDDTIVSTGYNGAPRGRRNCHEIGYCVRNQMEIKAGERYELCRSVHAEQNVIINASREALSGSTLYIAGVEATTGEVTSPINMPCTLCKRQIINAGIKTVVLRLKDNDYKTIQVSEFIENDDTLPDTLNIAKDNATKN